MSEHIDGFYRHGLSRMTGRDRHESGRVASPLELLFDLVFAAAFGVLGVQFAHGVAEGLLAPALAAFFFGGVAIIWAWINYTWFASAFDTDDWLFRVLTLVQMAGVIVLAIGLPAVFASIEQGGELDNRVMVSGYIVMRIALVCQWLRAARNEQYRSMALTYVVFIAAAQVGWTIVAWLPLTLGEAVAGALLCWVIELLGPILAERKGEARGGGASPWHAHHIAERYSLLAIIALGETVIGTIDSAAVVSDAEGWNGSSIVVIGAGIVITFALWWTYFLVPSAPVLERHPHRAFVWGYGHALIFLSIAAVGASLHMIGYLYEEHYHLSATTVMACLVAAVTVFGVSLHLINLWLVRAASGMLWVLVATIGLPILGYLLSVWGQPLWLCLLFVAAGPLASVIAYELGGWRSIDTQLRRAVTDADEHKA